MLVSAVQANRTGAGKQACRPFLPPIQLATGSKVTQPTRELLTVVLLAPHAGLIINLSEGAASQTSIGCVRSRDWLLGFNHRL
jgi:hypothetical protein